jgi:hypothetical protein
MDNLSQEKIGGTMKKALILVVLCLFLVTAGFSMGFSLKLTGGASYISSGDYNSGIDGINAYYAALGYTTLTGKFSKLQFGMDFGGELILDIDENWGVGIGAGYMRFAHDTETVTGNYAFVDTYTLKPTITSIPLTLNVHYTLPLSGLKLNIFAGVGLYLSSMKADTSESLFSGFLVDETTTFASNSIGGQFGFQGGLGLEIPLGGNISFVVDVTGRYVSLKDIKGDYTVVGTALVIFPINLSGNDAYFYTYNATLGSATYKMLSLSTDANMASNPTAVHAKFDLTGVAARAGFKLSF